MSLGGLKELEVLDFHTHTVFSDGELCPAELARRARAKGYAALGISDHADPSNLSFCLEGALKAAQALSGRGGLAILAGVELTHVPPDLIGAMVREARRLGASFVVVHGESPVEPVAPGTNLAAIEAGCDILAHPGFLSLREAALAKEGRVLLELSARGGHSLANGHVARVALAAGASLVVNSDAHAPEDILTPELQRAVALGAGLSEEEWLRAYRAAGDFLASFSKASGASRTGQDAGKGPGG